MKKQILILMLAILLVSPLINAETEYVQLNVSTNLKFTCTLNSAIPSASTTYNISVSYPNGSFFVNGQNASAEGSGAFNYSVTFPEVGVYKVQMFCLDPPYSFSDEGFYIVTSNGKPEPDGSVVVLFSIAFLIIIGFMLYQLILSIGHFASLDLDVVDLAKSFGIYFAVFSLYILSQFYLGNQFIERMLLVFIIIGGFTHILIPLVGFLFSITIGSLKKKKIEFGTQRIYRRKQL